MNFVNVPHAENPVSNIAFKLYDDGTVYNYHVYNVVADVISIDLESVELYVHTLLSIIKVLLHLNNDFVGL